MSLQFQPVRNQYISTCMNLWRGWNASPPPNRRTFRELQIRSAVSQITGFMVTPSVVFTSLSGWGSFSWTTWRLELNSKYVNRDDIRYGKFVEFCSTIYHETRHAEQFFRIAQGLALGRLKYPDTSHNTVIQGLGGAGGGVKSKIALFGGGTVKTGGVSTAIAASAGLPTASMLSEWLSIPMNVATQAQIHRDSFDNFCAATKPTWFKRETILKEVEEWMRATYKKTLSEMDTFAQAEDDDVNTIRANVYNMYRSLPEENDAHAIEELVDRDLTARIGHPNSKSLRRTNALFGP